MAALGWAVFHWLVRAAFAVSLVYVAVSGDDTLFFTVLLLMAGYSLFVNRSRHVAEGNILVPLSGWEVVFLAITAFAVRLWAH